VTTIDIPDLLSQYGDALEAEHPMPRSAVNIGANGEPLLSLPTGRIDPLDNVVLLHEPAPNRKRRVLTAAAVVIVAGLAAIGASAAIRTTETIDTAEDPTGIEQTMDIPAELQPLVFPGEVVLRTDPLVVIAAPPLELNFDTSGLGTEIVFAALDSLTDAELNAAIAEAIDRELQVGISSLYTELGIELEIRKITLLWSESGRVLALGVSDGVVRNATEWEQFPVGEAVRFESLGGGSGGGPLDGQDPDDPEGFRVAATVEEHLAAVSAEGRYPIYQGGSSSALSSGSIDFSWEYEVAREVAAVQMIMEGGSVWMRPIAGQVVLSGSINDQIELVTYNSDGEELTRRLATAEGG